MVKLNLFQLKNVKKNNVKNFWVRWSPHLPWPCKYCILDNVLSFLSDTVLFNQNCFFSVASFLWTFVVIFNKCSKSVKYQRVFYLYFILIELVCLFFSPGIFHFKLLSSSLDWLPWTFYKLSSKDVLSYFPGSDPLFPRFCILLFSCITLILLEHILQ